MKIFSTAANGNEVAEFVGSDYIKFSIKNIEEIIDWMKTTNKVAQPLLAYIEMLLLISEKYSTDANLLLNKDKVQKWKKTFNEWFERCGSKIPVKFRDGIKANGDELFKELEQYGH